MKLVAMSLVLFMWSCTAEKTTGGEIGKDDLGCSSGCTDLADSGSVRFDSGDPSQPNADAGPDAGISVSHPQCASGNTNWQPLIVNTEDWEDQRLNGEYDAVVVSYVNSTLTLSIDLVTGSRILEIRVPAVDGYRFDVPPLGSHVRIGSCVGHGGGEGQSFSFGLAYLRFDGELILAGDDFTWECVPLDLFVPGGHACGDVERRCSDPSESCPGCFEEGRTCHEGNKTVNVRIDDAQIEVGANQEKVVTGVSGNSYLLKTSPQSFHYSDCGREGCWCAADCGGGTQNKFLQMIRVVPIQ